jgi:hypothetical protein
MGKFGLWMLGAAVLGLTMFGAVAHAELIGVNFVGSGNSMDANNDAAGYIGQYNWNNMGGSTGWTTNLVNDQGVGTGVWMSYSSANAGVGSNVYSNPATNPASFNGGVGPQTVSGVNNLWSGNLRTFNVGGIDPNVRVPVTVSFAGLASRFPGGYDVIVYFGNPDDQGDQYRVDFDDGVNPVITEVPISAFPLADGQGGGGGRSQGQMFGYDDNLSWMGNVNVYGAKQNDTVASTVSSGIKGDAGLTYALSGDFLVVTVWDTNDNFNGGHPWNPGGTNDLGGPNWGPQANLGVVGIQIVPEPSSFILLSLGLAAFGLFIRRRG